MILQIKGLEQKANAKAAKDAKVRHGICVYFQFSWLDRWNVFLVLGRKCFDLCWLGIGRELPGLDSVILADFRAKNLNCFV
jgi:hypothetical protein